MNMKIGKTKKYELIETYPGSPKLGSIAYYGKHGLSGDCYQVRCGSIYRYDADVVENSPKHWKKIIEKDYEILKVSYMNKVYDRFDGNYWFDEKESSIKDDVADRIHITSLDNHDIKIHSVKRLSDGEVFTVGDKIKLAANKHSTYKTIIKIIINDANKIDFKNSNGGAILMNVAEKYKKPLFTTEYCPDNMVSEGGLESVEPEDSMSEVKLIAEAKKRYNVGDRFYPAHVIKHHSDTSYCIITEDTEIVIDCTGDIYASLPNSESGSPYWEHHNIPKYGNTHYCRVLYSKKENRWAEVIGASKTFTIILEEDYFPHPVEPVRRKPVELEDLEDVDKVLPEQSLVKSKIINKVSDDLDELVTRKRKH